MLTIEEEGTKFNPWITPTFKRSNEDILKNARSKKLFSSEVYDISN